MGRSGFFRHVAMLPGLPPSQQQQKGSSNCQACCGAMTADVGHGTSPAHPDGGVGWRCSVCARQLLNCAQMKPKTENPPATRSSHPTSRCCGLGGESASRGDCTRQISLIRRRSAIAHMANRSTAGPWFSNCPTPPHLRMMAWQRWRTRRLKPSNCRVCRV